MKRSIVAMSMFALLATGSAAACTKQAPTESTPSATASGAATSTAAAAARKPGKLGDTLELTRADGSRIAVTVEQIINPASVEAGGAEAGKDYIATKLKLTDTGPSPIEGDVNINVSIVGSDDQSYTADLSDVTECTNFESGQFHLGVDESATGCVVFALPAGVSPKLVKYVPSAGFADDFGEWLVK